MTVENTMTESNEELLPCPFCGGEPRMTENTYAAMAWVACPSCGLEAPSETGVDKLAALNYWNRRVPALALRTPSDAAGADITDELEREAHALSVEGEKRGADDAEMFDATAMLLVKASVIIKSLRRRTPSDGEVAAWSYELATRISQSAGEAPTYHNFELRISFDRPSVPEGSIRNLRPLYATPGKE